MKNWNAPKVEVLQVDAIARVEHPSYPLEWYLLALNPQDELCTAIINHHAQPRHVDVNHLYLGDLVHVFTSRGLNFETDRTFRRQPALRIWNKLKRIKEGLFNGNEN